MTRYCMVFLKQSEFCRNSQFIRYNFVVFAILFAAFLLCVLTFFKRILLKVLHKRRLSLLYFADTGLLVSMLDEEAGEDLRANKNLGVYKGALYENVFAEALVKSGYQLYYYKREDSTLEQDFFIRSSDALIPIEIKARTGKSKSLKTLIESDKYSDIHYGFKFSFNNIGYSNNIYTFPYFCAFLLKRFMKTFTPIE